MARLILLLALAAIAYLLYQWLRSLPREQLLDAAKKYALWGAAALLVLLVLTGRMHWLYAAIAAAVPLLQRAYSLLRLVPTIRRMLAGLGLAAAAPAGGGARQSSIRTRFLDLNLDHDSGEMDGEVNAGAFQGRRLSDLDWDQLNQLLREIGADPQSVRVMHAYLERMHGERWQAQNRRQPPPPDAESAGGMSPQEAAAILGVADDAGADEIRSAHRSLIQKLHPDRGGSAWLAARVNRAKDLLLGRLGER